MSFRDSDASRPSSRSSRFKPTLQRSSTTSYSSHSLNDHDSVSSESKRSRASPVLPLEELLKPAITIKVGFPVFRPGHDAQLYVHLILTIHQPQYAIGPSSDKPSILKPLMLLPRECLPLSTLDLSSPTGEFPPGAGRFFQSHIRILDLDGRLRQAPSVLLARSDLTRNVYAIERHQLGLYVVCKLGDWISIDNLSKLAEACYASRCNAGQESHTTETEAPVTTYQAHKENKKKRQAIEDFQQSMVAKRQKSVAPESHRAPTQPPVPQISGQNMDSNSSIVQGSQTGLTGPLADIETSAEDIFQNIRFQYFEALYHSKGSLAYFAKGTLSKARAAFHFDCDANLEMKDLLAFLKSIAATVPQIDKKFKETIPKLIDEMKLLVVSSEDGRKPKRRKPKKMKLGKDGMWTGEIEQVKKWWASNKPELREDDDAPINPEEIKYHISCLRTRETQLQMIIVLEILALEATVVIHDAQASILPGLPAEGQPKETVEVAPKKKSKQQDYAALLNLHADRMSIWQSIMHDDMKMIAAEAQTKSGQQLPKSGRADSNPSSDFCIDIIVPFFAGRLPELSAELNRKLGGPVSASPTKPEERKDHSMKGPARPGAATKRPTAPRASKSLVKVFEDDSQKRKASRARPNDALARMRSATPAAIPGIKREASDSLALDRIPRNDKSLKERSRNVLSRSLSSNSVADRKAQKKAEEAKQIEEAISGIRKPNRSLVGRAIIEDAEKRTASSSSPHPRKQRKPVRNAAAAAANRVQVKATPANYRFKDAVNGDSQRYGSFHAQPTRPVPDVIPSSSSVVPNTLPRKQPFRDDLRDGLAAFHIASTPLAASHRGGATKSQATRPSPPPNDHCIPESSPIMARRKAPPAPSRGDYMLTIPEADDLAPSSPVLPRLFETPVKRRAPTAILRPTFDNDENISSTPPEPRSKLVYATPAKKGPTSAPAAAPLEPEPESKSYHNTGGDLYQQMGWEDDFGALF